MCECVRIEKPAFIIRKIKKEIFSVLKDCFCSFLYLKKKNDQNASFLSSLNFWTNLMIALSTCLPPPPKKLFENQNPNQNQSYVKKRMQHLNKTLLESYSVNSLQIQVSLPTSKLFFKGICDTILVISTLHIIYFYPAMFWLLTLLIRLWVPRYKFNQVHTSKTLHFKRLPISHRIRAFDLDQIFPFWG